MKNPLVITNHLSHTHTHTHMQISIPMYRETLLGLIWFHTHVTHFCLNGNTEKYTGMNGARLQCKLGVFKLQLLSRCRFYCCADNRKQKHGNISPFSSLFKYIHIYTYFFLSLFGHLIFFLFGSLFNKTFQLYCRPVVGGRLRRWRIRKRWKRE